MAKAIIGQPYSFTVLFIDGVGDPVVPADPSIFAFYYVNGVQQVLVPSGTPMQAVPGSPGRYVYTIVIPSYLSESVEVYGVMKCTDPVSGIQIVAEQEVDLFKESDGGGSGLRVSFVKAGVC